MNPRDGDGQAAKTGESVTLGMVKQRERQEMENQQSVTPGSITLGTTGT